MAKRKEKIGTCNDLAKQNVSALLNVDVDVVSKVVDFFIDDMKFVINEGMHQPVRIPRIGKLVPNEHAHKNIIAKRQEYLDQNKDE